MSAISVAGTASANCGRRRDEQLPQDYLQTKFGIQFAGVEPVACCVSRTGARRLARSIEHLLATPGT